MVEKFPPSFAIGPHTIAPALVLAPMAGVTDTVFRQLIRQQGSCGLLMTEFTSSHGIVASVKANKAIKTKRYLAFEPQERPISAQLFGSDPQVMADAARVCEDLGFDIVDINFGCPVKKVVRCNGGSGCLRDLPLVESILKAVRAAIKIPLTCKFRSGWNDRELVYKQMGRMSEDCGLAAVALHPRTREQGYAGFANWTHIAELKAHVKIPVIGNGDVNSPEDAYRMVAETACDAVMIGRCASANPWIFRQIAEYSATGQYAQPTERMRYELMRKYFEMLAGRHHTVVNRDIDFSGGTEPALDAVGKMKQFATYFTHGIRHGSKLRSAIYTSRDPGTILDQVDRFFEELLHGAPSQDDETIEEPVAA
jgi:tRNA-dihydrouridine synthase B